MNCKFCGYPYAYRATSGEYGTDPSSPPPDKASDRVYCPMCKGWDDFDVYELKV